MELQGKKNTRKRKGIENSLGEFLHMGQRRDKKQEKKR